MQGKGAVPHGVGYGIETLWPMKTGHVCRFLLLSVNVAKIVLPTNTVSLGHLRSFLLGGHDCRVRQG
jgi:hypothetical protein